MVNDNWEIDITLSAVRRRITNEGIRNSNCRLEFTFFKCILAFRMKVKDSAVDLKILHILFQLKFIMLHDRPTSKSAIIRH